MLFEKLVRRFVKTEDLGYDIEKYNRSINELEELTNKLNEKDKELKIHYKLIELENDVLLLMAKDFDFYKILEKICDSIEKFDEDTDVFVSILDYNSNTNNLHDICTPNLSKEYVDLMRDGVKINPNILVSNNGACKREIIDSKYIEDRSFFFTKHDKIIEELKKNNISTFQASPIIGGDCRVLGLIILYYKDENYESKIYKNLLCWASKILSILIEKEKSKEKIQNNIREIKQKNNLLESIIDASGGYLWLKDENDKYQFSDYNYHYYLFNKRDKNEVIGKSDYELVNEYNSKVHKDNQYDNVSLITDDHTKEIGQQSRFLCGLYVGYDLFIFEMIKTPLYDTLGNYKGIVGFLWDRSNENKIVSNDIEILRDEERLELLSEEEYPNIPFIYYIIPSKKYYRRLISKPIYEDPSILEKRVIAENFNLN